MVSTSDMLDALETLQQETLNNEVRKATINLQLALYAVLVANLQQALKTSVYSNVELSQAEKDFALKTDGKIAAIKAYRTRINQDYGYTPGLRESKELVEKYMQEKLGFTHWPASTPSPSRDWPTYQ